MNDNFDFDDNKTTENEVEKGSNAENEKDVPSQPNVPSQQPNSNLNNHYYNPNQSYNPGGYRPYNGYQNPNNSWQNNQWQQNNQQRFYQQNNQPSQQNQPYQFSTGEYDSKAEKTKVKKKNKGLAVFGIIIAGVLAICVLSFATYGVYTLLNNSGSIINDSSLAPDANASNAPSLTINDQPQNAGATLPQSKAGLTASEVNKKVSPSIVGITVYYETTGFSNPVIGSGIIMSKDGYIVTNAHVVNGGAGINVTLNNGEEYEARLIGMDTRTDLAVVKIDKDNLPFATFGNSDQVEVGDDVLAMGSPAGLEGSVSKGIISAKDRDIQLGDGSYSIVCLQTDAAISPGISGGALVNMFGQVVGITSAKLVNEDIEGIGFAIPINNAKPIVDDLIKSGRVTGRVRLGITAQAVDDATAAYNGVVPGIRIISTEEGTDIAKKGVKPGDIITKVNNMKVQNFDDVGKALNGLKPGSSIDIEVYRPATKKSKSSTFTVSVKVIEAVE